MLECFLIQISLLEMVNLHNKKLNCNGFTPKEEYFGLKTEIFYQNSFHIKKGERRWLFYQDFSLCSSSSLSSKRKTPLNITFFRPMWPDISTTRTSTTNANFDKMNLDFDLFKNTFSYLCLLIFIVRSPFSTLVPLSG